MVPALQQNPDDEHTADSLKQAVRQAQNLDYTNGMATEAVVVERETETVKVIRKAPDPKHPQILLFIATPTSGYVEPSVHRLQDDIADAAGLYGDVNVKMKTRDQHEGSFDCVLPESLF